jgi:predicted nucleic acid-binding protein
MIVDASVILMAFFPDEAQDQAQALIRDHVSGQTRLAAPTLLLYEVTHAVLQAARRGRIGQEAAEAILTAFEQLEIEMAPVAWQPTFSLAQQFDRSAYDAAYLALAQARGELLVTGDLRLYHAVHERLDWVCWVGGRAFIDTDLAGLPCFLIGRHQVIVSKGQVGGWARPARSISDLRKTGGGCRIKVDENTLRARFCEKFA